MPSYFFRTIVLLVFALVSIFSYYFLFPFHAESSQFTGMYLGIIVFFYACYKGFYVGLGYDTIEFSPSKILLYFLLHLFLLSFLFFHMHHVDATYSILLTGKIIFFMGIVFALFLVITSFGEKLLSSLLGGFGQYNHCLITLFSFAIGFSFFLISLTIVALLSLYTIWGVLGIVGVFAVIGWKEILKNIQWLSSTSFSFENHDFSSKSITKSLCPYLVSTEFLFIIVTGVIAVNLINVVRPFPIGWDDLGVYMNYPKLIAASGGNIALGSMYPWQLFTGIGFLVKSQSFAFFLNSFSAILSFFVLYLGTKLVIPQDKKTLLNLPFLSGTVFLALPMVIFQVAKDMKLDVGLFALSFACLLVFYYLFTRFQSIPAKDKKMFLFLGGIILGVTFSIKVTSLLLISGIIGILFYRFFRIWGFVAYVFLYIAFFTFFGLWGMMNVVYPEDNQVFVQGLSAVCLMIGIAALGFSFLQNKEKNMGEFLTFLVLLVFGILLPLIPWQVKHISELRGDDLTVARLLGGNSEIFTPDYSLIYDVEALQEIEDNSFSGRITSSGAVENEDFGRYIGYEEGINNYLKLPWNLTMQVNQNGEFTDITYIFFALLPGLFLFLPYRKKIYYLPVVGVLIFELLYFLPTVVGAAISGVFASISLPLGYAFLLLPMIGSSLYFYYTLERKNRVTNVFLLNYVFCMFYLFLWSISAFGIVWYGIVMYGSFLLMIGLCLYQISSYSDSDKDNSDMRGASVFIVFCVIFVYFFHSSIPHYLSNLQKAGYSQYKKGEISEHASLFKFHPEYLDILFSVNIREDKKEEVLEQYKSDILSQLQGQGISADVVSLIENAPDISGLNDIVSQIIITRKDDSTAILARKKNISNTQENLYEQIILPSPEFLSDVGVFRIGTFLKYFIANNHKRLLEDSLITAFDTYYYDDDVALTYERMKKTGIGYILVDLNAATIDNDPRKDLTRRYENMLKSFTAPNLKLIETDSMCLGAGLHYYNETQDMDGYLALAGVNYGSDDLSKKEKLQSCYNYIFQEFTENEISQENYAFLLPLKNFITERKGDISNEAHVQQAIQSYVRTGYKALFEIQ